MKTLYLVPHAHYDVVWSFDEEDYLVINERILHRAAELIEREDFRFMIEQTYLLERIEQRYPRLFSRLKRAIEEGRVEICDGMHLMPDSMIPHGEVLVREILFGKRYAKERFGVDVPVAWAADGFGFNAQMPQLYRKSGYEWVAFRRGIPERLGAKASEFTWEALDGSRLLAHWMPLGYRAGLFLDEWDETVETLTSLATTDHVLMPCGSGSTPPQYETQEAIRAWNEAHDDSRVVLSTPRAFFEALEEELSERDTALHHGELYRPDLENVFQDVTTSRIGFKMAMRDAEHQLLTTEALSTLAWLQGLPYPAIALRDAWKGMLYNAFHDVISGSGIDEVYDKPWDHIRSMAEQLPGLAHKAMRHLVADDTVGDGIVVFNPSNWTVEDWVEVEVDLAEDQQGPPGILLDGHEVPSEVIGVERWDDGSPKRARIGFTAEVPAQGTRVYEMGTRTRPPSGDLHVLDEGTVETPHHRVQVDPDTGLLRVWDLEGELLVEGNEIVIEQEHGDLYFHRNPLDHPIGRELAQEGLNFGTFKPEGVEVWHEARRAVIEYRTGFYCMRWPYRLIEDGGPILHRQKVLDVVKRVVVYHDTPRIDCQMHIDSQHPQVRLRVRFDPGMEQPQFVRETQFGAVPIPTEEADTEEGAIKFPSHGWLDAHNDQRGLALFTRGVPIHEVEDQQVYLTLLRSVQVLCADGKSGPFIPVPDARELGEHHYEYALFPHQGDWRDARIHRQARQFTQPLAAIPVDTEPLDKATRGFELGPENLVVTALKRHEDGEGVVLRFYEATGRPCRAKLRLPGPFERVRAVNLLEEQDTVTDKELVRDGDTVELDVGAFEIVTLELVPEAA